MEANPEIRELDDEAPKLIAPEDDDLDPKDLIDDDPEEHLRLTFLIATGDFSEQDIQTALRGSKRKSEVYHKLLKIQSDRELGTIA